MKHTTVNLKHSLAFLASLVLFALSLVPGQSPSVSAEGGGTKTYDIQKVIPYVFRGDVRSLPHRHSRPKIEFDLKEPQGSKPGASAPAAPSLALAPMPGASHNFAGMSRTDICTGGQCGAGIPPDTNGDVGRNHYIQAVNSAFAIYNKSGTLLASFTEDSLWSGSTNPQCNGNSEGDPVVLYDALADRWILTDFAFSFVSGNPVSPFYQCIAVSRSNDPVTGGWNLYPVRTDTGGAGQPPVNTLNDYPKFGIWTDCLYYSANGFLMPNGNYNGGEFGSFSRSDMYAGLPLTGSLGFNASTDDFFTMIPSNLSAPGAGGMPSAGTPNYYVQESLTAFNYRVRKFTPGPNCGGSGTLGTVTTVSQTSYSPPGTNITTDIIPQPSPATSSNLLDSLGDRLMQKVQYRKVGSAESLWVTHTFRSSSSGPTGQQWTQINVTGGTVAAAPVQQQLYNPGDGIYRWMGSIAADKDGNMALGYSTSNGASPHFPSIAYAGRLVSDPLNTLPQSETMLIAGAGSQVNNCGGSACHRWGDYSAMSVDPADGCTFWYISEYFVSQAGGNTGAWNTRIGSFKFPSCGSVIPTNTPTPTPIGTPGTGPTTLTFISKAVQDGWILESSETSSMGGSLNSTASAFRLGDDASRRQYRSILSFNTGGLPDNAVITSATLQIRQAALVGANPFSSLGNIMVDIRKGAFSRNAALQVSDFQATASQKGALIFTNNPVSGLYSTSLNSAYFGYVSLTGITQFRLRFAKGDNNNSRADYLKFYSGNYSINTAFRPALIIQYHLP